MITLSEVIDYQTRDLKINIFFSTNDPLVFAADDKMRTNEVGRFNVFLNFNNKKINTSFLTVSDRRKQQRKSC